MVGLLLGLAAALPATGVSSAPPAVTGADLMAAVQALRAKQGLPPRIVDAAITYAAQRHSEYQAAIGTYSHIGEGGTRAKDRAIAAGFGGGATIWMSENVAMANNRTGLDVVLYTYWGDFDHWNTMTNPQYIYGGAGAAEKDGVIYYTLDTGYIAGGTTQATYAAPASCAARGAARGPGHLHHHAKWGGDPRSAGRPNPDRHRLGLQIPLADLKRPTS